MSLEPNAEKKIVKITQRARPASRVVIVDRDSMSSDLLATVLTLDSRCEASAIQPSDLLRAVATNEVDVVVIGADLNSESGSGFDLADAVSRARPSVYIVILLNETTHEMVIDAFRSGARGVFSRQQPMADFLDCVEHVRRGFLWAGTEGASCLLEAFKSIPAPNLINSNNAPALTARELQVVQCAATGKTNRTIATELNLSEHTVKNYLFRAFEKLGVSSRVELLFYLTIRGHTFNSKGLWSSKADLNTE
jgi:two-component system nitrate/nitrite response regulator NarL